ncbi:aldo/keto reductase family protein [Jiangella muralis]|uniref:aldo/keto reductase family protein n=1 Tax=Jiangella muralis TaxID=702383 RepID=UPI001969B11B|nr:aldo/keto reductase family protein [Jiangella muralis]
MALGTWLTHGGDAPADVAIDVTRRAHELGVNLFDTANVYPHGDEGDAERVLGRALAPLARETYIVATKVCAPMGPTPLERGLSRKHIVGQVDGSLRRLGMDYIDLYQCHRFDPDTPVEETASTMTDLVRSGKILYWGVSEWDPAQLHHLVKLCREVGLAIPVSNQLRYSALWRAPEQRALASCADLGVGVLAYSPLADGVLTGKYRPATEPQPGTRAAGPNWQWMAKQYFKSGVLEAAQDFRDVAETAGVSPARLALAWCLRRQAVSGVVVGASRLTQLEDNVLASGTRLDSDVIGKIDDALRPVQMA